MADSPQERLPHILRPEVLDASAASVHTRNSEPQHSSAPLSLSWPLQTSLSSHSQHSHPEPARLVLENVHEPGVYPMTSGVMGNVVMQSAGEGTDQYVVLIGNVGSLRSLLSFLEVVVSSAALLPVRYMHYIIRARSVVADPP